MKTSLSYQSGLSLLEMLISSAIASGLLLLILHLFSFSNLIGLEHQRLSRQLENAESVRHLLSHSVRDALHTRRLVNNSEMPEHTCPGILLNNVCNPPLQSWKQGSIGPIVSPAVLADSYLLRVKQSCCPGIIADLWFIAYRGGNSNNPPSLFRRRQFSDGRFSASEEMVEGVAQLTPLLTQTFYDEETRSLLYQAGLSPEHINNWWAVVAVQFNVSISMATQTTSSNKNFSFTIAARQWSK